MRRGWRAADLAGSLAETLKKHRAEIEKDCMTAYTISFDYMLDPDYFRNEKAVQAKKGNRQRRLGAAQEGRFL